MHASYVARIVTNFYTAYPTFQFSDEESAPLLDQLMVEILSQEEGQSNQGIADLQETDE